MITKNTSNSQAIVSDNLLGNVSQVGITNDVARLERMSEIFQDDIYERKLEAALRETFANMLDEHQHHNVSRPAEVSFKRDNGQWSVTFRDFAKGLDDDGVRKIFGMLLESTKDKMEHITGGFGVGAKAPISYNEEFYVTSFFGGKETKYLFFRDRGTSGSRITKITVVDQKDSSDPTGILVEIPLKMHDLSEAVDIVDELFLHANHDIAVSYKDTKRMLREKPVVTVESFSSCNVVHSEIFVSNYHYSSRVRMGHITYPMPNWAPDFNQFFKDRKTILDVPVGALDIPISRESISDTPQNRRYLEKAFEEVKAKATEIASNYKWKIEDFVSGRTIYDGIWVIDFNSSGIRKIEAANTFDDSKKNCLVFLPNNRASATWRNRLKSFLKDKDDKNYFCVFGDEMNFISNYAKFDCIHERICGRKMGLPKWADSDERPYQFKFKEYSYYGPTKYSFTVKEFFEQEIEPNLKDFDLSKASEEQMKKVSLQDNSTWGVGEKNQWSACKGAVKAFVALGGYDYNSPELQARRDEIKEENRRKAQERLKEVELQRQKEKIKQEQKMLQWWISARTQKILDEKKPEDAEKCLHKIKIAQAAVREKSLIFRHVQSLKSDFTRHQVKKLAECI